MWRQRFRWFKGGHLFLLSPTSVFFDKSKHMSFYQKSLYWICLVANVLSILADPILLVLPPLCLVLNVCVYGLDQLLFWTHLTHTIITQFSGMYYAEWGRVVDALKVSFLTFSVPLSRLSFRITCRYMLTSASCCCIMLAGSRGVPRSVVHDSEGMHQHSDGADWLEEVGSVQGDAETG